MKTTKITFSITLILIMGLLLIWNTNLRRKKSNFKFLVGCFAIWNILTKVKIQVAQKCPIWVFKTNALEPRSQRSNQNKDPSLIHSHIVYQNVFNFCQLKYSLDTALFACLFLETLILSITQVILEISIKARLLESLSYLVLDNKLFAEYETEIRI